MANNVAVAIDFGNFKLRLGVNYNNKVEIIKNEENYSSFSQILIVKEKNRCFGTEAERNYAGKYNNCFKEFKYNFLKRFERNNYCAIIEVLKYYKSMSEEYVRNRFNKGIENINKVILTIPSYDFYNKDIWKYCLYECSREAGFKEIITVYEEMAACLYYNMNISEQNEKHFYCIFNLGSLFFFSSVYDKSGINLHQIKNYLI
jgi:molecular chaperone DnaK (HSP70)